MCGISLAWVLAALFCLRRAQEILTSTWTSIQTAALPLLMVHELQAMATAYMGHISICPISLCCTLGRYLVLVQLTVLVLLLSLLLEGDDDETHEDVHHEEGDDDDVDDEEDGDLYTVVVDGAHVLSIGIDGFIQQPGEGGRETS